MNFTLEELNGLAVLAQNMHDNQIRLETRLGLAIRFAKLNEEELRNIPTTCPQCKQDLSEYV